MKKQQCSNKICLNQCVCLDFLTPLVRDQQQVIFRGFLVHNPANPAINVRQGSISYRQIQGIPIKDIMKIKLCSKNQFLNIKTLQIYIKDNQSKPILLGVDSSQCGKWLFKVIQAKLTERNIHLLEYHQHNQHFESKVLKKSGGKWKFCLASFQSSPKCFKFQQDFQMSATTQIWTRFDLAGQPLSLIVKLWGALGSKKQFGVPLAQLSIWIQALSTLL